MNFFENLRSLNWSALLPYIVNLLVAMPCITLHELAHGWVAYKLGDPTAKSRGRLTLNPIKHVDPLGLILMVTLGFGWAKPVPVDMRNFKNPKKGMAITSLAGPAANFLLSLLVLVIGGIVFRSGWPLRSEIGYYVFIVLVFIAVRSTMLGIFNLIPIPPLDGSKVVGALLPDRVYYTILRYERYCMIVVFALCYIGVVSTFIVNIGGFLLDKFCVITFFPREIMSLFI